MILRRFMHHIEDQNWFAVGLDVCVVILGVYIGIFLGDSQSAKQRADETQKALMLLRDELKSDLIRMDEVVGFQKAKNKATNDAMKMLETPEYENPALKEAMIIASGDNYTFFPSRSAYEALKASGNLASYENSELRQEILILFERAYHRQDYNAQLYDNLIYDILNNNVITQWDMFHGKFYENTQKSAYLVRNGLLQIIRQGEWYQNFLDQELRERMTHIIAVIDQFDDSP